MPDKSIFDEHEFDPFLDEQALKAIDKAFEAPGEPPPAGAPPEPERADRGVTPAPLVRASDLIDPEAEKEYPPDFSPDGRYKDFAILERTDWPEVEAHADLPRRFYVISATGVTGLVPFEGSHIVWPWEAGWHQDLRKQQVQSYLKDEKKKK